MEKKIKEKQGKALENFQLKPKSLEPKPNFKVEGKKKKGKMTLKERVEVVFTKMDKFERWVNGKDVH
jgi:hypothetical protein